MNEELLEEMKEFFKVASENEKQTFEDIVHSLIRKQKKQNASYLGELLHAEGKFKDNQYEMTIPNSDIIQNSLNIVHGGITATLIDSAMGSLAFHLLPEDQAAVTTELKINYLAPGIGSTLTCIASLINRGSNLIVTEGKVFRDDGKLIAHATGSFFIIKRKI
ncbi:PaaI family thioesterase [Bacillus sp. PS06]|uniref:PaaI family thioesterase n=1 Tax=Bacillus sp. PS06 TaxID=2764176 RepID=UPI001781588D|nr:PaaI family thioesterase [Bacillus sp. PS06]MBD8068419.1 PaaI family thioesterase [Bacillus sp. PS06]